MIKYPNGIRREINSTIQKQKSKPKPVKKAVQFGKRGMNFEAELNATNDFYLAHGLAVIHKKPTPIQIVKVDYPQRSRAKITEAYFRQASTTDYSGVFQGHYIDFEAKETMQKTSFPLKNFHDHQIDHMKAVLLQKGLAFVLLHFASLQETYLLMAEDLVSFYEERNGQKSIPLNLIQEKGYPILMNQIPRVPYLDILKKLL